MRASPSPSELLPDEQFHLYAVCARSPHNLAGQIPWQERQEGVYDCRWELDAVRVVVAGQLPQVTANSPLDLFSASPELAGFGDRAYRRRSAATSLLPRQLLERLQRESLAMADTMADFNRQFFKEHFAELAPEEREEVF